MKVVWEILCSSVVTTTYKSQCQLVIQGEKEKWSHTDFTGAHKYSCSHIFPSIKTCPQVACPVVGYQDVSPNGLSSMQAPRCLYPVRLPGIPSGIMEDKGHQLLSPPNALCVLSRLASLYWFGVCLVVPVRISCLSILSLSVNCLDLVTVPFSPPLSFLERLESGL